MAMRRYAIKILKGSSEMINRTRGVVSTMQAKFVISDHNIIYSTCSGNSCGNRIFFLGLSCQIERGIRHNSWLITKVCKFDVFVFYLPSLIELRDWNGAPWECAHIVMSCEHAISREYRIYDHDDMVVRLSFTGDQRSYCPLRLGFTTKSFRLAHT